MTETMERTQIYLTTAEKQQLKRIGQRLNRPMAELIRDAVDRYLASEQQDWKGNLLALAGTWKDDPDRPDLDAMRKEWDR